MAKAKRTKNDPADFDFAGYLYDLERLLPERSRARKLVSALESYVDWLRIRARRPWESCNYENGTERDQAKTALFESIMRIPREWRSAVAIGPMTDAISLDKVPDEVVAEVQKLLERERNYCYISPFIMLRLKGEVALTDECKPAPGSGYERRAQWAKEYGQ